MKLKKTLPLLLMIAHSALFVSNTVRADSTQESIAALMSRCQGPSTPLPAPTGTECTFDAREDYKTFVNCSQPTGAAAASCVCQSALYKCLASRAQLISGSTMKKAISDLSIPDQSAFRLVRAQFQQIADQILNMAKATQYAFIPLLEDWNQFAVDTSEVEPTRSRAILKKHLEYIKIKATNDLSGAGINAWKYFVQNDNIPASPAPTLNAYRDLMNLAAGNWLNSQLSVVSGKIQSANYSLGLESKHIAGWNTAKVESQYKLTYYYDCSSSMNGVNNIQFAQSPYNGMNVPALSRRSVPTRIEQQQDISENRDVRFAELPGNQLNTVNGQGLCVLAIAHVEFLPSPATLFHLSEKANEIIKNLKDDTDVFSFINSIFIKKLRDEGLISALIESLQYNADMTENDRQVYQLEIDNLRAGREVTPEAIERMKNKAETKMNKQIAMADNILIELLIYEAKLFDQTQELKKKLTEGLQYQGPNTIPPTLL